MPTVFISYRHESPEHCASVMELGRDLEAAGITVILDAFAQEREFCGGGPDRGWPHWSRSQARDRKHKILIAASGGWFGCYLGDSDFGASLGSAAEATIVAARLYRERGVASFFRIVKVGSFDSEDIPDELAVFHVFRYREDLGDIIRWLNAGVSQAEGGRGEEVLRAGRNESLADPRRNGVGIEWRRIPAGPCRRGFTEEEVRAVLRQIVDEAIDREAVGSALKAERRRVVQVGDFEMAANLVTNGEFGEFIQATDYRTSAERRGERLTWRTFALPEKTDHPVVQVTLEDAQAFCTWAKVRLPTLDEWIKAYRGPEGRIYPWGERYDPSKCNTEENKTVLNTSPVDMFARSASYYGCNDMIGNVNEWVDATGDVGSEGRNISPGMAELLRMTRVVMGGAWNVPCQAFGLPVVNIVAPVERCSNDLGFRVAR